VQADQQPRTLGKYELVRLLGRGGMGDIHLARLHGELGFEKRLVLKTIRSDLAADPRFIELFAAEAKIAVTLSHPNITPIYELGRADDGTLYTAMGWVDGPSLQALGERLRERGQTLELGAALFITRELLDGLAYAHSPDRDRPPVVHRDITPSNVLVDRSGRVQIVDFGIAKPAHATVRGAMGSVGYMAPEQARGAPVDPRADVFSVGCVLYELLTGQRAFEREGVWMLPSFAEIPASLQPVLERALALDADDRFPHAEALLRAIAPILAEHAPTFGTRDLAAILAGLFDEDWHDTHEVPHAAQTPATLVSDVVQTFATRVDARPDEDPEDEAANPASAPPTPAGGSAPEAVQAQPRVRRGGARLLAGLLALAAGLLGYALARNNEDPSTDHRAASSSEDAPAPVATEVAEPGVHEPPSADAIAGPTRVDFDVRPADAHVEVDGEALAGPPYFVELRDKPVELHVRHPDHRPRSLTLEPDAPQERLHVELDALEFGSLTVLAPAVAWAEVWLDGDKLGTTPLTAKPVVEGKHKLEVRCTAAVCGAPRVLLERSIRIRPGRALELRAEAGPE
jgi:eukaryotic-like serine/threonine-protein kinase